MEIEYERKHNDSYMVVLGKLEEASYETKMIKENSIPCLLEMTSLELNGVSKISYKISRKQNLEDYLDSVEFDLEILRRLIINIKIALDELSKYLIDETHISLDKEMLFLEKSGNSLKISLCYVATSQGTIQQQFRDLMDYFLSKLTHTKREEARIIYTAYDLCLKEDYTLEEIIECLEPELEEPEVKEIHVEKVVLQQEPATEEYIQEPTEETSYLMDLYDELEEKESPIEKIFSRFRGMFTKLSFEDELPNQKTEDFVIEPDYELEEKTVLLTDSKPVGRLVYDGNSNEDDFIITKDVFTIGKSKNNDAVLKSRTVSGNHAKITKQGNDFFLTDSNSTNGSFLNSLPLVYKKPYRLKPMDVIRFASESYIFY